MSISFLNSQQERAAKFSQGPLLIVAGAGTGKTTVITERIKYFISTKGVKPENILALTFTDKAAREMQERVDVALPYGYVQMWISTFHSFCDQVLRQEALHIGLSPDYKLMSGAQEVQFFIDNLFRFDLNYFRPLGNPTKFVYGILQHFSRLRDEDITPRQYLLYAQKKVCQATDEAQKKEASKIAELANAFKFYDRLKIQEGKMDFSDLASKTIELFRRRKNILEQYQKKFNHILVDEFQDTNFSQYTLIKLLAPSKINPQLSVVGDDAQSIYRFRGAAIANILQFMKDYPTAKQVVLTKNYRSSQAILDAARRLIKNNDPDTLEAQLKIDKNLVSVRDVKNFSVEFMFKSRVEDEAQAVAQKISQLKQDSGQDNVKYEYKDFAILLRANSQADSFTRALARAGIPFQFLGPGQLLRQPEVKDLIAYLKVLYDFSDNVSLHRVLSMPIFDLSGRDLAAIGIFSRKQNISFFEACEQADQLAISEKSKEVMVKFTQMVNHHLDLAKKETAGQITYYFLHDSGLLEKLAKADSSFEEKQIKNISLFFDRLKSYETENEDASVRAVVSWIDLAMNLGDSPLAGNSDWTGENKVNLLTVHSAKGLEFSVVFLVNLVAGRFPTYERHEQIPIPQDLIKEVLPVGDYHLQEERRLFYVGMTRAKDRLFLTAANWYGEGKRVKKVSGFVSEALGKSDFVPEQENIQLSFLNWAKPEDEIVDKDELSLKSIDCLSYSQIETFDNCPLQYCYRYVKKIPSVKTASLAFGDCMHKTLRDFFTEVKGGSVPSWSHLDTIFKNNWQSTGYLSKSEEEKAKKAGERMLKQFYEASKPIRPASALEQPFMIKINENLKLRGKIDRVCKAGGRLEIIDYKTGKEMEQKEVDKSLQMTIYALAAIDKGLYGQKAENITLTFYFLDSGKTKSTTRSSIQLEKAKKEIELKAQQISTGKFPPRPGLLCKFCPYKMICEAWE